LLLVLASAAVDDSTGRLATTARGQLAIGLEVGWMR
jgi:hypothetical protein